MCLAAPAPPCPARCSQQAPARYPCVYPSTGIARYFLMSIGISTGRAAALALGLLVLAAAPTGAQAPRPDCVKMLEERLKIIQALNGFDNVELPSDKIRELQAFLAELKSALGETGTDAAAASKKIEDAIGRVKKILPSAEGPLKQIAKALKDGKARI